MTQATVKKSFSERIGWEEKIRPLLVKAVILAVGFLAGLYIAAPVMAGRQANHLPSTFLAMPQGVVEVVNEAGSGGLLPVRVADTSANRGVGFRNVGEQALDNQFMLYVLTRPTTNRASYSVDGFRAPIEFAAVSAEGEVVARHVAPEGATRVSVPEPHQWLLSSEAGTFERFGIDVGSRLDPETIRKF